jgi:hypothetical protein
MPDHLPVLSPHWSGALRAVRACDQALAWAATQPDAATAWAVCERADWLLWIASRLATTDEARRRVALAACACARTALVHIPAGEDRPRLCIETIEAWTRGEATADQISAARRGAQDAAAAYAAYAAAAAAYAAAYAAASADASVASASAADAASVASASAADAAAAAWSDSLRRQASIVRRILPMPVVVAL